MAQTQRELSNKGRYIEFNGGTAERAVFGNRISKNRAIVY